MRFWKWNETFRRSLAGLLAAVMLFGMFPGIPYVHAEGEETAQQTAASLDDIAWEDLSYRDIFITNNRAYLDGFNAKTFSPFIQNTGTNTVTADACYTGPYSLMAFGGTSQQIKSASTLSAGDYFIASKVYCTRYAAGELGVCVYSTTVGVTQVTEGFVTASGILSCESGSGIFIGSIHSADLDGYVDDPAVVDLSIFRTRPSEAELTELYEQYVQIEKARVREEILYTEQEMLDAFVDYMNSKAAMIGMGSSTFNDPVGMDNLTTARDLARLMVYAHIKCQALEPFWSTESHVVSVGGSEPREKTVSCSYYANPFLEPYYHILGVKGGSLTSGNIRNLAAILEIPDSDDRLAVVALYALGESDTETGSRAAVKQIADAAMIKYKDPAADNSNAEVSCQSAIAVLIPAEGADLNELQILYEKDADTQRKPASVSKVLTALCVLEIQEDLSDTVTYRTADTDIGGFYVQDFLSGETVTVEDALYALMLTSSNVTAQALGRETGLKILEQNRIPEPQGDSLDDIAWEDLSYRDIFITNNKAYLDGFNTRSFSPYTQHAGTNTVTKDACYTGPYSLAAFGNPSQQIRSAETVGAAGDYFVASKVWCTRYAAGELGVCLHSTTVGATQVTQGFVTAAGIISAEASDRIYIGSIHSADLDGYVDDPAVVNMSIFNNRPSEAEMAALYERYVEIEKSRVREEVPYTEQEMLDAFVACMNEKAASIGMENSNFTGPVGTNNTTTAEDLLRLMVAAEQYDALASVWGTANYTVTVSGESAREQNVVSTVIKPALEDHYHILGGKTGTLSSYNARNLAVILEIPGSEDRLAVVALYADGLDTDTNNRFEAARQIADAALAKYANPTLDNSSTDVCCASAMACLIPAEGADLKNLQILYEKDASTQRVPASITKVLTAICALDHLPGGEQSVTYSDFDTQIGGFYGKDFYPGDTVSFTDALYAMLLPSSNVTARAVARTAGGWILSGESGEPVWEVGTIAYANGLNRDDPNRLRTAGYLKLADYGAVSVGSGFDLVHFVYDADLNVVGKGNWLGAGNGFSISQLQAQFPDGIYFRVAVRAADDRDLTLADLDMANVIFYAPGKKPEKSMWELGTIASADGQNNQTNTRLRTVDYLRLEDYGGVGIGKGYTMTNFVYDAEYNYLGTSSWIGNGMSFTTTALQAQYPDGVYFRVALRALDQRTLTVEDIPAIGVKYYAPGESIPQPESDLKCTDVGTVGSWQDGSIYDGKLFVFGGAGTGAVYDLDSLEKLGKVTLDNKDILKPHANSVCFGSTYFAEGDQYPLLYVNIYNNYASAQDRMEGTCCVYRVTESDGQFSTELVQVIRIGFTEDLTLWKSKENNGDVRPYGNFVVDTDHDKLYAFVMRDADKTTRFFKFDLPALTEGVYSETYGCNVVTLESADIESQFDTAYFNYLQGCCYHDGQILSVEGFNSGGSAEPALRIIDLTQQKLTATYYPAEAGLTKEPEVICVDPSDNTLYYAAADGVLRVLTLPEVHTHTLTDMVTAPTCTEQGYTTHTCRFCGESFVDSWVEAVGHSYGEWIQVTAPSCGTEGRDMRSCVSCGEVQYRDTRVSGDPNKILVSEALPEDYFEGKKIVLIGDSITYGVGVSDRATETYGVLLGEMLGATVVNKGVSGSGYCSGGKMATNKTLTEDNIRDADVITIMLGINDFNWAVKEGFWNGKPGYYDTSYTYYQLGEFGSDDTSTFYGALKSWCEKILELKQLEGFEDKQFVVITPMISSWNASMGKRTWDQTKTNVHGHTLRQYCTAIMEVCAYYDIPVFDANMFSGIYYNAPEDTNVQEVGGDGVHVNAKGHELLAQSLAQFLLEGYSYEARAVTDCGHSYTSVITEPTCTGQGYTTHSCPDCHYSYTDTFVDAMGHTPGEAVKENEGDHGDHELVTYCTVCGEELSREVVAGYTPGDITGDGSVDNKDLTRLFRYLSGYDVQVVEAALDVNGDGSINNKDQTRLFRYLSGWDVEIC